MLFMFTTHISSGELEQRDTLISPWLTLGFPLKSGFKGHITVRSLGPPPDQPAFDRTRSSPSASSPIIQDAAPTSWRAFCATSAQRVRHRQSTTFAPGSAAGPSHSLGPPGDMAHVRRALANALVAWAAMRFPPPPETLGWSNSAHST
ncbi:hypothetical protein P167DRAFT_579715 [Morchella conica CCBAS932]|uniref:Uncharacterized protein n=1 Tax=Morchella conica CCBAS932 TaxID=1392247 RepID=A0A3N4KFE2_9PEZI|nr:hypothetical protein P167DRAFT_579715 [Morchella conica CCBAS932]